MNANMAPITTLFCWYFGFMCNVNASQAALVQTGHTDPLKNHQPVHPATDENDKFLQQDIVSYPNSTQHYSVSINTSKAIHIVDRRYLSTGFGASSVTKKFHMQGFDPKSVILQTLLRGLSPAIVRVGGRSGDEVIFALNGSSNTIPHPWINVNHFLTGEQWRNLNEFCLKSKVDLAFTLNLDLRKGNAWDPTNAKELLDFNANLGYRVIWELGNEPKRFRKIYKKTIIARQLAKDFITLRAILSEDRYRYSNELVGPDMDHLPIRDCITKSEFSPSSSDYLRRFLKHAGDAINATTVHFYNIDPDNSTSVDNFTDPDILLRTRCELEKFRQTMRDSMPTGSREKWLGETSTVSGGGLEGVSNRYVAGFPLLHNLGLAAEMGVSVFIYWNLFNADYSLLKPISDHYAPTPLYWVCFLHKRLLDTHILSVSYEIDGSNDETRGNENNRSFVYVFAHCTKTSQSYPTGAVTIIAVNLYNDTETSLSLTENLMKKNIDEYLLTAPEGILTSKNISLNGRVLQMKNFTHFPDIIPRPLPVGSPILLPPRTYGFYVIKDAEAAACQEKKLKADGGFKLQTDR
ncbi:heparanase-like isoform X1 [Lytechinus pictus]|uniref:heparanase-like isoform X1 n=1 Tax=Lytechinus pictus TaxID=7653 RepID=UPI0030B9D477